MNAKPLCDDSDALMFGLSPCPNDTFIFHALLHGLTCAPVALAPHFADVEELNARACQGLPAVTKMSVGAVPYVMDKYALLSAGAALGWGCGPLVLARKAMSDEALRTAHVVVPGRMTTADLLLTLHGGFQGPRTELLFSDIMPAVARHEADIGVVIHEGRFTYEQSGLVKILDLGAWWESAFAMPLPLGVIAVRRDVPRARALALEQSIAASLMYARAHPEASADFVREHAQELDKAVIEAHIRTFVTDFSQDLNDNGRSAVSLLVGKAAALLGRDLPAEGLFVR